MAVKLLALLAKFKEIAGHIRTALWLPTPVTNCLDPAGPFNFAIYDLNNGQSYLSWRKTLMVTINVILTIYYVYVSFGIKQLKNMRLTNTIWNFLT